MQRNTVVRRFGGQRVVIRKSRKYVPKRGGGKRMGQADPLAARIKQVLNRQSETKYVSTQLLDNFIVPYTVGPANQFFPCTPQVSQGSGTSFQRIGERIKPIKAKIDFIFSFDETTSLSHDYRVKLFVLRPKTYNNFTQMVASGFTGQLLDNGNQTDADWDPLNQHISDCKPINDEVFTPITIKRFKLIKNPAPTEGVAVGNGSNPNLSRSNIVRYSVSLYGKALKKNLIYQGALGAYPNNYNPIFGIVAYAADGTAPLPVSPIKASVRLHMWFKDE